MVHVCFRHELKHRLSYSDYLTLRTRLRAVMSTDSHADESGEYRIRSLYFDNYNDKALKQKIDGVNEREKFRIRYYNFNAGHISLEKKYKACGLSEKTSAPITKEETERIISGDTEWMRNDGRKLVRELYIKMEFELLRPKVIVDYIREPYIFTPGNVRVTLDRDIRTAIKCLDFFESELPTVKTDETILLEVKYDSFLPELIFNIVQLKGRREEAFSKYAASRMYG